MNFVFEGVTLRNINHFPASVTAQVTTRVRNKKKKKAGDFAMLPEEICIYQA